MMHGGYDADDPGVMMRPPVDEAPRTVRQMTAELYAAITRDGGMDEDEMQAVGEFFQAIQDFVTAQRQTAAQQPPLTPGVPTSNVEDYGAGAGAPIENYL